LKYFPDLFVMHKSIRPLYGTFFIVLLVKGKTLTKSVVDIYKNYFPSNILVVYENDQKSILADLGKPEEIGKVFNGFQKYLYQPIAVA